MAWTLSIATTTLEGRLGPPFTAMRREATRGEAIGPFVGARPT
jgi:hypothetical protein